MGERAGDAEKALTTIRCRNGHTVRIPTRVFEVSPAPIIRCLECGDEMRPPPPAPC